MTTIDDLEVIVQNYYDELDYQHPFANSDRFVDNSYGKWACKEILQAIKKARTFPFDITAFEILDGFAEKMKRYAYMNSKNSLCFVIAQETAEYLIEQCWINQWKKERRKR